MNNQYQNEVLSILFLYLTQCDNRLVGHLSKTHSIHIGEKGEEASTQPGKTSKEKNEVEEETQRSDSERLQTHYIDSSVSEVSLNSSNDINEVVIKKRCIEDESTTRDITCPTLTSTVDSPSHRQLRDKSLSSCMGIYDVQKTLFQPSSQEIQDLSELSDICSSFSSISVDNSELSSSHDKETEYENLKAVQVATLSHSITENKKCVICSENDVSKLRQVKILREKRGKQINWPLTFLICFYHKIGIGKVEESYICYKHYAEWYNFYRKYKDMINYIFEGDSSAANQPEKTDMAETVQTSGDQAFCEVNQNPTGSHNRTANQTCNCDNEKVSFLHYSGEPIKLMGIKIETIIKYMPVSDVLSLMFTSQSIYKHGVVWQFLCKKKFYVQRPFNSSRPSAACRRHEK